MKFFVVLLIANACSANIQIPVGQKNVFNKGEASTFTCIKFPLTDWISFIFNFKDETVASSFKNITPCNYSVVQSSYVGPVSFICDKTNFTLIIHNPQLKMNGKKFQCRLTTSNQTFTADFDFSIKEPISNVMINSSDGSLVVVENKQKEFRCSASGFPEVSFEWYLNFRNATRVSVFLPEFNQSKSIFTYIGNRTHDGKYIYCTAFNLYEAVNSSFIKLDVIYAPTIKLVPSVDPLILYEGQGNVDIHCVIESGKPLDGIAYNWTVPWGGTIKVDKVSITNVHTLNDGNYTCSALNSAGFSSPVQKKVIVHFSAKILNINDQDIEEGSRLVINPTINANPEPISVWWTRKKDSYFRQNETSLDINNITRDQDDIYVIHVQNVLKPSNLSQINKIVTDEVVIRVSYGPNNVPIYPTTTFYTKTENTDTLGPITCTADCRPNCTMKWSGPNLSGGTTDLLILKNISRKQAGKYRCTARNSIDSKNSTAIILSVNYVPTIQSIDGNENFNESDTAIFYCNVDSIPESTITWKFIDDNTTTEIRKNTELNYKSNGSFLKVVQISCLSMGLFRCEANNSIGIDIKEINVTVMCAPRLNTFEHEIPSVITVKDNESLNITAWVLAFPRPYIYWQFINNSTVTNITKGITSSSVRNRHVSTLFIQNMSRMDFGLYAIYADNNIMISKNYIGIFDVQAARRPDKPKNVTCSVGYNYVIVNWNPEFNGGSPQHFTVYYKKNLEQYFTQHQEDVSEADYHPVKVANLESSRTYLLRVHAINEYNATASDDIYCNTTAQDAIKTHSLITVGVGAGLGSAVAVTCVVVVVLFVFQRQRTQSSRNDKVPIERSNEEDENDELKNNPLYVSSGDDIVNQNVLSKQALNKRRKDKRNKPIEMGCVYENHEDVIKENDQTYANQLGPKVNTTENEPMKNKDGLIYADLDLAPVLEERRFVIRGVGNKTNYAIIDLNKKAGPLQSGEEEEETSAK